MTPVARNILIACIAGFLLQLWSGQRLGDLFALWPLHDYPGWPRFQPWQLVSYAFLHGNLVHLLFNMFALYMFGPSIEELIGSRRFLVYYFVCVITAALTQLAVQQFLGGPPISTVGASGGVFGLLLAYGLAFPRRQLMLFFPPIPMPAWLFVTLYGLLELYLGFSGRNSNVAHFAHLGGMAGGLVLILYWRSRRDPKR
ncbi:MAG TPA: rhomboid family intramembrane serine protease [Steroidobacteraceae bacterium]|nr:rhomboid family intramembrane serine protease [Steroidobacteraceae bacterium]